jgi:putative DNA primase/helicase
VSDLVVSYGAGNPAVITEVRRLSWDVFAVWLTNLPKEATDKAAHGWYIPAEFNPVYRDSENFVARHAITFDFDHVDTTTWDEALNVWSDLAFAIYTTFSHRSDRPRFRVVMPLSRPAGYDEFQAVARQVATDIGIQRVARESFVPSQMMYSPARPAGGIFRADVNVGQLLDVDAVLAEYADWTDQSSWPRRTDGDTGHLGNGERTDARDKPGIIGEFNRAFTISQAIEKFDLPYRRVK